MTAVKARQVTSSAGVGRLPQLHGTPCAFGRAEFVLPEEGQGLQAMRLSLEVHILSEIQEQVGLGT